MKVLVTGSKGQLGSDIVKALKKNNIECIGVCREDFDACNFKKAYVFIEKYKPDFVIHCASYNYVDKAEDDIKLCNMTNIEGTKNIANICNELNATMVCFSTDYVFDGTKNEPYEIFDRTNPLSVYGKSKEETECIIKQTLDKYFILRISWLFGREGTNFVKTMLKMGKEKKEINVVKDQIGSPTYTVDIAEFVCGIIQTNKYGIYHVTNEGFCSWAEFAEMIFKLNNNNVKVNFIETKSYISRAQRPLNSMLSKKSIDEAGFSRLPHWQDALNRCLLEIKQ